MEEGVLPVQSVRVVELEDQRKKTLLMLEDLSALFFPVVITVLNAVVRVQ
jgi:hypothetical protein